MDTSSRQWIVRAAVLAALITSGCTEADMKNWNLGGQNKSAQTSKTTPTVKASPVNRSAEGQHPTPPKQDEQAQVVDEKVDQYVQSMNSSDAKYGSNREGAKSTPASTEDPTGEGHIQQTAARDDIDSTNDIKSTGEPKPADTVAEARTPAVIPAPEPEPVTAKQDDEIKTYPANDEVAMKADDTNVIAADEIKTEPKPVASHTAAKPATGSNDLPPSWSYDSFNDKFESSASTSKTKAKPPVVEEIKIEAAPADKSDATAKTPEAPSVRANTPPSAQPSNDVMKARIAEQEAKVARDPNNVEEQFKLRLLYLSDNQDEKAMASTPGINADILDIMRAQIQSLISARSSAQRDPALWANRQLEAIENLRTLVRSRADIKVTKVAICRSITSFGVYEPIDPPNFKLGQRNAMFLYVPIENYKTQRTESGMYRTLLSIRYSVIDSNGKELWSDKIENIEDLAREHRQDFYLGVGPEGGFVLPPRWGPGEYTIKVEVEDMLAQKINSNSTKFKIVS